MTKTFDNQPDTTDCSQDGEKCDRCHGTGIDPVIFPTCPAGTQPCSACQPKEKPQQDGEKCDHAWTEEHLYCLKCGESRVTTTVSQPDTTDWRVRFDELCKKERLFEFTDDVAGEIELGGKEELKTFIAKELKLARNEIKRLKNPKD